MSKKLTISICFVLFSISSFSQNTFYKAFDVDYLLKVIKTLDGGFACITTQDEILVIDSNTQVKFHKKLPYDTTLMFYNIIQTTDSGFILSTVPVNHYGYDYIIRLDKNGNYLWTKKYYHSFYIVGIGDIIRSENNGFYILSGLCGTGPILIKCDPTGAIIWQKIISKGPKEKIIKYSDDKFLIFGTNHVPSTATYDLNIMMVDTIGNILWEKEYDNYYGTSYLSDVVKTCNNEYSILTSLQVPGSAIDVTFHIDSLGNLLWAKKIYMPGVSYSNHFLGFTETIDKGHLFTGAYTAPSSPENLVYLKMDSINNIEWARYYSHIYYHEGTKVFRESDNYYVFCNGGDGISIAKLDQQGFGFCNFDTIHFIVEDILTGVFDIIATTDTFGFLCEDTTMILNDVSTNSVVYCTDASVGNNIEIENEFNIFPNPTSDNLTIETSEKATIEILNIEGQIIKTINTTEKQTSIDVSDLSGGVYIIKAKTEKGIAVKKFIKE